MFLLMVEVMMTSYKPFMWKCFSKWGGVEEEKKLEKEWEG